MALKETSSSGIAGLQGTGQGRRFTEHVPLTHAHGEKKPTKLWPYNRKNTQGSGIRHDPQHFFLFFLNFWTGSWDHVFYPPQPPSSSIKKHKMLAIHSPMLTVLVHFTKRTRSSCVRPTAQHHVQPLEWDLRMQGRQTPLSARPQLVS